MAKMSIVGNGFAELAEQLDKITGDLKPAVNEALVETANHITPKVKQAMAKHSVNYSGDTKRAIIDKGNVQWSGQVATVDVGFELKKGYASIFLMYGTPRYSKDQNLYNAIKGTKTKKEIEKIQAEVMQKYINLGRKG